MELNYCRRCGNKLELINDFTFKCPSGHLIFHSCSPSTGVFMIDSEDNILMSVRAIEPNKGMLDAIGGFLDGAETAENGLPREIQEETGLTPDQYSEPVFLGTAVSSYDFMGEGVDVLTLLYYVRLKPGSEVQAFDDVAEIKSFKINDIPLDQVHNVDILRGIELLEHHLSRQVDSKWIDN